jgi:ATP-binding cassette subfamily F protein uup
LKILLGKEIADSGEVVINKDVQVVLFDQEIEFESQLICGRIYDDTRF